MITLNNVSKIYINNNQTVKAVDDVSFKLPNKGVVHLNGKSGSGKSTLLGMIGAICNVSSGEINYGIESDVENSSLSWYLRNQHIGFIYQNFNLIEELTVYENVKLALELSNTDDDYHDKVINVLKKMNILDLENRFPSEISGGEKQRVAISRILVKGCKVILADEPTGNLDESTSHSVLNILSEISKDILVVVASHDIGVMKSYYDYQLNMSKGKIDIPKGLLIETNKESTNELNYVSPYKLSLSRILSIRKIIAFKNNLKRNLFTFLLSFISLFSIGLFMNLSIMDEAAIANNIYTEQNVNELAILNTRPSIKSDLTNLNPQLDPTKVIRFADMNYSDMFNLDIIYNNNDRFENITQTIRSITVQDSVENDGSVQNMATNEIILTDFVAQNLVQNTNIDFDSPSELINEYIEIKGHEVLIIGILDTGVNYNAINYDDIENYVLNYDLSTIYMNDETYNKVKYPAQENAVEFDSDYLDIYNFEELTPSFKSGIDGNYPTNSDEIVVSRYIANHFNIDVSDANNINKEVTLELFNIDSKTSVSKSFVIVGILDDFSEYVVFEESMYYEISESIGQTIEYNSDEYLAVNLDNVDSDVEIFKYINDNNLIVVSECSDDVDWAFSFLTNSKLIIQVLMVISLIGSLIFMYLILSLNIEDNKRNIGILLSLGARKIDIMKMVLLNNIIMISFATLASFVMILVVNLGVNRYIHSQVGINGILYTNLLILPLMFFITSIIYALSSALPLRKLYKQEIVKLTS